MYRPVPGPQTRPALQAGPGGTSGLWLAEIPPGGQVHPQVETAGTAGAKEKAASKQTKPAERAPKEQLPPKEKVTPAQDLEYNMEDTKPETAGGIGLIDLGDVVGDDEPDEEADSPPGR